MNQIKLFLFTLLLLVPTIAHGQTLGANALGTMGSLSEAKTGSFTSLEAGFSIGLPAESHGFSGVNGMQYSWRLTEGYFSAGSVKRIENIEEAADFELQTEKVADGIFLDFIRSYFDSRPVPTKVDKKAGVFHGHKGMDYRIQLSESICMLRVFWVKNQAYRLGVLLVGKQAQNEAIALKVLDSVVLITPESLQAMIQQKLSENTPAPLPQSPAVKKLRSDAEDANLKGRVKEVIQTELYIAGARMGSPSMKSSEDLFNQDGSQLKSIRYDDTSGFPQEVTAFGYIGGFRVSRSTFIKYGNELTEIIMDAPGGRTKRRDPRYDARMTYKYDLTGKLIERVEYDNAGSIWIKTVFQRAGNVVKAISYDGRGKVNQRWSTTYDEKGNELESVYPNSPLKGWTYTYEYKYLEFDDQGNWTKRNQTEIRAFGDASKPHWTALQTRTITYY